MASGRLVIINHKIIMASYEVLTRPTSSKGENEALQGNINLHVSFTSLCTLQDRCTHATYTHTTFDAHTDFQNVVCACQDNVLFRQILLNNLQSARV